MTQAGTTGYTYDANGNPAYSFTGVTLTRFYNWTAFNKVKSAGGSNFSYGPNFERRAKTYGGGTTHYMGKLFEQYTAGTTAAQRHFLYAGDRLIGLYNISTTSGTTTRFTRYYHLDHLGSPDTVTDEAANVLARLSYDAFGKRRKANGTETGTITTARRGFTGLEHDDELGLINMDAREEDPKLGRFISPDPLAQAGDPNPYAYAGNNPLRYVDPSGTSYVSFDQPFGTSAGWFGAYGGWAEGTNPYTPTYSNTWNNANSGSSTGSSLWGNTAPTTTTYSLWPSSGLGNFADPNNFLGAGGATGLPNSITAIDYRTFGNNYIGLGDTTGYWVARSAANDPIAPTALTVLGDTCCDMGWIANRWTQATALLQGTIPDMGRLQLDIAIGNSNAVYNDTQGVPGLLNGNQVSSYHHDALANQGLAPWSFGGTPFGATVGPITFPYDWCVGCDYQ